MERRQVSTPKEFFESERDRFYSDWTISFWREFFQNSVDAGARKIDITIHQAPPRGAFDSEAPAMDSVTRIVFSDDGCGMTQDVLDKVYFSIGSSTKGEDSIGGYGRARLMTCFSNVRYSILTNDRFVLGDGPDWVDYDLKEAQDQIETAASRLRLVAGDRVEWPSRDRAIDGLESDLELIKAAELKGGYKGCRVEVDLDPSRGYSYRRPTVEKMLEKLREYLSESQITPKITINGRPPEEFFTVDGRLQAWRGAVRRVLSANIGGKSVPFANVHLSEGGKAAHKKKVIVRVDGAAMYTETIDIDKQVIVELFPAMSREVMTSNRDGLKDEYRRSLQALINELVIDNKSALKNDSNEVVRIKGEKGVYVASKHSFDELATSSLTYDERDTSRITARQAAGAAQIVEEGVPIEAIEAFLKSMSTGESFVDPLRSEPNFRFATEFREFRYKLMDTSRGERVKLFFTELPREARNWVIDVLSARFERKISEITRENISRGLSDMHDVVVHVENASPAIRGAMRRNDPRNWDTTNGKGRQPRALLVAWTEACAVAIEALMRTRPSIEGFEWSTGWCYDMPKEVDQGDREREAITRAMCVRNDEKLAFLINPVTEEGKLAFNPSDAGHRQKLQALAMHEVAHVVESWHNETYAGVLTSLMEVYDYREANRRMKEAVKGVYVAYEKGKARVQALDESDDRPAARLLALAAPGASLDGSIIDAITRNNDDTYTVDCDLIDDLERKAVIEEEAEPAVRFGT